MALSVNLEETNKPTFEIYIGSSDFSLEPK